MTFEMFEKEILKHLQKITGADKKLSVEHIKKNNNKIRTGIRFEEENSNIAPVLYMEEYYQLYMQEPGMDLEMVAKLMLNDYKNAYNNIPDGMELEISNYEKMREHIIYRLINYEKNREILQECPYIKLYDLAVTFRWIAYIDERGIGTTLIKNRDMEMWNVDTEELILAAQENTPRIFPATIVPLDSIVEVSGEEMREEHTKIYVCTNTFNLNGAGVILYHGVLETFARQHQTDFYVLPSSIHEMLFIPAESHLDITYLHNTVREVNHMVVDREDILAESIYCYRWKEERLEKLL